MSARYIVGDVLDVLRAMPDASVDLVLSSPPFLALRSYLPADHPDKAKEIGSEPTPGAFIDTLLDIVEECRRVLAPHGSLCFELGDTYAGSGGAGGDYGPDGLRVGQAKFEGSHSRSRPVSMSAVANPDAAPPHRLRTRRELAGWPLDKSLCLIPELLRVAMVYGINPLTGRATPRWRARNVVRWCRPNPPVGALGDKVRPATSDIIVACVDRKRYFDLDAVRHVGTEPGAVKKHSTAQHNPGQGWATNNAEIRQNPNGAPPLDHWWHPDKDEFYRDASFDQDAWHIPTEPYKGSHYATWPTDLLVKPILAMCPTKVCTTCGKPSERITSVDYVNPHTGGAPSVLMKDRKAEGVNQWNGQGDQTVSRIPTTTGWTDCGHGSTVCASCGVVAGPCPLVGTSSAEKSRESEEVFLAVGGYTCPCGGTTMKYVADHWRKGVVLDPFGGSGTTAVVALGHGRDAILIDLDERNADLARDRVGMWLTVEHHVATEVPA